VAHYRRLERDDDADRPERAGDASTGLDVVIRGTADRVAPIVLTTAALGLALLPMALAGNAPGGEVLRPLAVVALGGLATSALVNLYLIPALYAGFIARPEPSRVGRDRPGASPRPVPVQRRIDPEHDQSSLVDSPA
jgi:hypothetical protein